MTTPEEVEEEEAKEPQPIAVEDLQREAKEAKDKNLLLLAEMENLRKRHARGLVEHSRHAVADLLAEFLQPLDTMDRALSHVEGMSPDVQAWASGFQMILTQFKDVLTTHHVMPMECVGKQFDPHYHEAVEVVETDEYEPGTIIEELLRGYRMDDRTIRPARVKVAKAKQSPKEE